MPRLNNFVSDFRKDHAELQNLIVSLSKAIESSHLSRAKESLVRIETLTNWHFDFEETYLYPRLGRLLREITENLKNEQRLMREFIGRTKNLLGNGKVRSDELSAVLEIAPKLFKFFKDCNELAFLVEKFSEREKEELSHRFKEYRKAKTLIAQEV